MKKNVLICGASFAGLSTAYWMKKRGYNVTVVEINDGLKKGGTPVNIQKNTIDIVRRMGFLDQIRSNRLKMEGIEFIAPANVTEKRDLIHGARQEPADSEYEIERDVLLNMMFEGVKDDVEFVFGDSLSSLQQRTDRVTAAFKTGHSQTFDLVFGCDGIHSTVRKFCFGEEAEFSHFLQAYFSITIVNKSLIRNNTTQLYNEPGKAVMLNAYNGRTDIILCFFSEQEITYDYRNEAQQRKMILDGFANVGWRTPELLEEMMSSKTFYFDKLCQMKMPSWTNGRVALVGDAAYCASPAAGRGGSLAIDGAAALADAFQTCRGDHKLAFQDYNRSFRPFIEGIQATVVDFGLEWLIPRTEEAIRRRNSNAGIEWP